MTRHIAQENTEELFRVHLRERFVGGEHPSHDWSEYNFGPYSTRLQATKILNKEVRNTVAANERGWFGGSQRELEISVQVAKTVWSDVTDD